LDAFALEFRRHAAELDSGSSRVGQRTRRVAWVGFSAGVISAVVGERAERVVCARTSAEQARSRSPVVAGRCWGPGVRGVRKAHPAERRDVRATLRRSGAAWTLDLDPLRSWLSTTLADGPVVIDPTIEIDPDTEAGVPVGSR